MSDVELGKAYAVQTTPPAKVFPEEVPMLHVEVIVRLVDELGNMQSELKIPVSMTLFADPESFGAYIANSVEKVRRGKA